MYHLFLQFDKKILIFENFIFRKGGFPEYAQPKLRFRNVIFGMWAYISLGAKLKI